MFDFRYHALSLVAVFLALGIGILLGATIGDSLVSTVDRGLRSSLQHDVQNARANSKDARDQIDRRDRLLATVFPRLAANQLHGRRIGIVATGALPDDVESPVREAIEVAEGKVDSVTTIRMPTGVEDLADTVDPHRVPGPLSSGDARAIGRRLARTLMMGGRGARALERALPDRFRGEFRGMDAVVFFRTPPERSDNAPPEDLRDEREREVFESGMVDGMRQAAVPVVGVEDYETDPSQIPYYERLNVASSVDSVDLAGGKIALVYALDGAEGAFGFKGTAERPVPDLAGRHG